MQETSMQQPSRRMNYTQNNRFKNVWKYIASSIRTRERRGRFYIILFCVYGIVFFGEFFVI